MAKGGPGAQRSTPDAARLGREILALVLVTLGLFLTISALSYRLSDPTQPLLDGAASNWGGAIGHSFGGFFVKSFGLASYPLFGFVVFWGILLFFDRPMPRPVARVFGAFALVLTFSVFLAGPTLSDTSVRTPFGFGGGLGHYLAPRLYHSFGSFGVLLLLGVSGCVAFLIATDWPLRAVFEDIREIARRDTNAGSKSKGRKASSASRGTGALGRGFAFAYQKAKGVLSDLFGPVDENIDTTPSRRVEPARPASSRGALRKKKAASADESGARETGVDDTGEPHKVVDAELEDEVLGDGEAERAHDFEIEDVTSPRRRKRASSAAAARADADDELVEDEEDYEAEDELSDADVDDVELDDDIDDDIEDDIEDDVEVDAEDEDTAPRRVASATAKAAAARVAAEKRAASGASGPSLPINIVGTPSRVARQRLASIGEYKFPPLDLLEETQEDQVADKEVLRRHAEAIERRLGSHNVECKVVRVSAGPAVTVFELELSEGTRVTAIPKFAPDLAAALKAFSVRVVAPIPGKHTVGIEVPNERRSLVRLRELCELREPGKTPETVPLFLGRDVAGQPIIADLARMPHLLIAGATGSGKSVCINSILLSILLVKSPDDVRVILIDPKMVELQNYASIPHLLCPVVTSMKRVPSVLEWSVETMEQRYALLSKAGVRNLKDYNALGEDKLRQRLGNAFDPERTPIRMPTIVMVIDEFADLMAVAANEVEVSIQRLAQKSRAVGIHVILATQRPSRDVITGLIKANLPTRIAFQVSSRIDSRVVLDANGAEQLLGHGDMLYIPPGTNRLIRAQGTFISDDEIHGVTSFLEDHGQGQVFETSLTQTPTGSGRGAKERDELYEDAVRAVLEEQRGSATLIQRKLSVGYTRASRLIELMAEDGIVGEFVGSKSREVMMTLEEWEAIQEAADSALDTQDAADVYEDVGAPSGGASPFVESVAARADELETTSRAEKTDDSEDTRAEEALSEEADEPTAASTASADLEEAEVDEDDEDVEEEYFEADDEEALLSDDDLEEEEIEDEDGEDLEDVDEEGDLDDEETVDDDEDDDEEEYFEADDDEADDAEEEDDADEDVDDEEDEDEEGEDDEEDEAS
ncbi:MAG: DNA translocase FtsK 4TM domain-containing protein [Planctomycetes bacterium]|nr:DNA translocase FtsK 4TM domain-containing protein [Planctomycetota bacterium]MCB9890462.1 DNA translocase FtsK 4TM domain-containing protein [Planctomycetota bacterium]MCB9917703.1 DNA translocase FtsK 4TM domain-containing protein [Planctomycetota bacterium]